MIVDDLPATVCPAVNQREVATCGRGAVGPVRQQEPARDERVVAIQAPHGQLLEPQELRRLRSCLPVAGPIALAVFKEIHLKAKSHTGWGGRLEQQQDGLVGLRRPFRLS